MDKQEKSHTIEDQVLLRYHQERLLEGAILLIADHFHIRDCFIYQEDTYWYYHTEFGDYGRKIEYLDKRQNTSGNPNLPYVEWPVVERIDDSVQIYVYKTLLDLVKLLNLRSMMKNPWDNLLDC